MGVDTSRTASLPLASSLLGRPLTVTCDEQVSDAREAMELLDTCATTILVIAHELPHLFGLDILQDERFSLSLQIAGE